MRVALQVLAVLGLAGCDPDGAGKQAPDVPPGVHISGVVEVGVTGSF